MATRWQTMGIYVLAKDAQPVLFFPHVLCIFYSYCFFFRFVVLQKGMVAVSKEKKRGREPACGQRAVHRETRPKQTAMAETAATAADHAARHSRRKSDGMPLSMATCAPAGAAGS